MPIVLLKNTDYCAKCRHRQRGSLTCNVLDWKSNTPPSKPRRSFLPLSLSESDILARLKHLKDDDEEILSTQYNTFSPTFKAYNRSLNFKPVKFFPKNQSASQNSNKKKAILRAYSERSYNSEQMAIASSSSCYYQRKKQKYCGKLKLNNEIIELKNFLLLLTTKLSKNGLKQKKNASSQSTFSNTQDSKDKTCMANNFPEPSKGKLFLNDNHYKSTNNSLGNFTSPGFLTSMYASTLTPPTLSVMSASICKSLDSESDPVTIKFHRNSSSLNLSLTQMLLASPQLIKSAVAKSPPLQKKLTVKKAKKESFKFLRCRSIYSNESTLPADYKLQYHTICGSKVTVANLLANEHVLHRKSVTQPRPVSEIYLPAPPSPNLPHSTNLLGNMNGLNNKKKFIKQYTSEIKKQKRSYSNDATPRNSFFFNKSPVMLIRNAMFPVSGRTEKHGAEQCSEVSSNLLSQKNQQFATPFMLRGKDKNKIVSKTKKI